MSKAMETCRVLYKMKSACIVVLLPAGTFVAAYPGPIEYHCYSSSATGGIGA